MLDLLFASQLHSTPFPTLLTLEAGGMHWVPGLPEPSNLDWFGPVRSTSRRLEGKGQEESEPEYKCPDSLPADMQWVGFTHPPRPQQRVPSMWLPSSGLVTDPFPCPRQLPLLLALRTALLLLIKIPIPTTTASIQLFPHCPFE